MKSTLITEYVSKNLDYVDIAGKINKTNSVRWLRSDRFFLIITGVTYNLQS